MLTFLLGPFLALLPKRWRLQLPFHDSIEWRTAGILSGFAQMLIFLAAMLFWYSYSVLTWVSRELDSALVGNTGHSPKEQEIGFMAITIFATHPLTWLIGYLGVEGAVRFLGALSSEDVLGILPLFLLDRLYLRFSGRGAPSATKAAGFGQSNFSSYKKAIREHLRHTRNAPIPDELFFSKDGGDETLEIRACRRKPDWDAPRTVLYQEVFYRLETSSEGPEPRTYRYHLRRLSAGVMGRSVLVYSPEDSPVVAEK